MKDTEIKTSVRNRYAEVAKKDSGAGCCSPAPAQQSFGCSGGGNVRETGKSIGYTDADLNAVPDGANLGLGCGNPVALASLKKGETVLDLGSGAGFDCFLAAQRVGENGKVIGVDMTPEMIDKARANARKSPYKNVEFRLGEIENLPAADGSIDAIISNCVINLAPDKNRVFAEAYRVLKPGGRIMVSDLVLTKALPEKIKNSIEAYVGCIAGASIESEYIGAIKAAGFKYVKIVSEAVFPIESIVSEPLAVDIMNSLNETPEKMRELARTVKSVKVSAVK